MFIKVLFLYENEYDTDSIQSKIDSVGVNRSFEFFHIKNDNNILENISIFNPHIILSFTNSNKLQKLRFEEQEKIIIISSETSPEVIGEKIMEKYLLLLNKRKNTLFSIITPIFKTPIDRLERLYNSLLEQTYNNWEWIVFDDSPPDYNFCYSYINKISKLDNRIQYYRKNKNSGIIGDVKNSAFSLGSGEILVEVDHDDVIINTTLENLKIAYSYSNDIGFVYGHTCELFEYSNKIMDYGDGWGYGYGSYINTLYKNKEYKVAIAPNINSKTIRGIIGVPNHVRSWKKEIYQYIGGHNKNLHVADDFELIIRTFLETKMAKIDAFTYIQYFDQNSNNTQLKRNSEIQRLVLYLSKFYNTNIHNRFIELDVDDFIWKDNNIDWNIPNPNLEPYANIIIPHNILKNNLIK